MSEPVQAALARVSADRASPEQTLARLQRAVSAAESRLEKAKDRLARSQADDGKRGALEATVKQLRLDLENATNRLADHQTEIGGARIQQPLAPDSQTDVALDRARLAIEKAQQKAEQMALMSEAEKLQNQRDSVFKRLEKARGRARDAEVNGDANLDAFITAVANLEAKLRQLDADLAGTGPESTREHS